MYVGQHIASSAFLTSSLSKLGRAYQSLAILLARSLSLLVSMLTTCLFIFNAHICVSVFVRCLQIVQIISHLLGSLNVTLNAP